MTDYNKKIEELGIDLPKANAPVANYVPFIQAGNLVFISGQVAIENGEILTGKLGKDLATEDGVKAAKICAKNVLTQLKSACGGDFNRVKKCVKIGVFVNSAEDYASQPEVANGVSDLIVEIFAEKGKHARAAVGCSSLPRNTAVEVEAIFEIEG